MAAPLSEDLLLQSPVAHAYTQASSIAPPPRGIGVSSLPAVKAQPFTEADAAEGSARAYRISAFSFRYVDDSAVNGDNVDIFGEMPNGILRSASSSASASASSSSTPQQPKRFQIPNCFRL